MFLETPRFPDRIAYGAQGGPEFSTQVVVTAGGNESRNARWAYPRQRWDVSQGINSQADFENLRAFFMIAQGRRNGWRFKDWTDFRVTATQSAVVQLSSTTWQLAKRYALGGASVLRPITKPVTGTVVAQVSAAPVAHTVDYTTGVLTIASAPATAAITWSGEFDVPMRFDTDALQARVVARNQQKGLLHAWESIPVVELPR
jgi:uncharacterized protein (TIGR02217 family)